jgi:hypothetical protein
MCTKYKWTKSIFNLIDWELHSQVLSSNRHRNIFNLKYVHFWLPVASHGSMTPQSPTCLRCNTHHESQVHWYQCSFDTEFRLHHLNLTIKFLESSDLHTHLQQLVLLHMYQIPGPQHQSVLLVEAHQSAIGWDHFLRGRIASTWTSTQNKLQKSNTGTNTMSKVLSHIFQTMHEFWIKRNQDTHGNSNTTIRDRHCQTFLVPRVNHLYNNKQMLPAHDQQILETPIEEFLKSEPQVIARWLQTNEEYLQASIRRENNRIKTKTQNITKYFPVTRDTASRPKPRLSTQINRNAAITRQTRDQQHHTTNLLNTTTTIITPITQWFSTAARDDLRPP